MGAVKKVFKSVGGLLGFGGSDTPSYQQVTTDPVVTQVSNVSGDTSGQDTDSKKKRRKGFASTQTSTLMDNTGGNSTLG